MGNQSETGKFSNYIFGKNVNASIENKIFILMTSLTFTVLFLGNIVNIVYELPLEFTIFSYTATFVSLLFYIKSRNNTDHSKLKPPYFVVSIILLITAWFFNDGINGMMIIVFIIYFTGLYAISPSRIRKYTFIFLLLLLPSLIAVQYYYPDLIIPYDSREQRFSDLFFGSILFLFFLYVLIDTLIKKYEFENKKSEESNRELLLVNEEIKRRNEEIRENNLKIQKSENDLRTISNFQKAILDNAGYAIISTDKNGIIKTFNPAAERMLGYSSREILGKFTPEIFHKKEEVERKAIELSEELNMEVHPGFEVFIARARLNMPNEFEWTYVHKSGTEFPVQLNVTSIYNDMGEINGFLGIANNISKRKKTEKELKLRKEELEESEQKYRTLFQDSHDALLIIDNNVFVDCNSAALELLKYDSKEIMRNIHPSKLSPPFQPDGRSSFEKAEQMMAIAKENGSHRFEWVHRKANGEDFYAEVSLTIIPFKGRHIIHTAWRDITDRKKMIDEIIKRREEAEKANQLKSEFLAQMSHEIRSPINSILNFTSLIEEMTSEHNIEDIDTCFTSISNASTRVIRTIDSILNMSELQLGTYQVHHKRINLCKTLRNLIDEYRSVAEKKGLTIGLHLPDEDHIVIENDEYAINQIFANLIDNAIKYTSRGRIEVHFLHEVDKNTILVKDTGKGISVEYLPFLFEPFTQEEQGYTRKYDGNGLGMSLVKRYCELVGAEISVESNIGVGTEFRIVLK